LKKDIEAGSPSNYWLNQLDIAKKRDKRFLGRAKQVVARYRDDTSHEESLANHFNILWSNTDTMQSHLFTKVGNPDVRREFSKPGLDEKISKTAAVVLENALKSCSKGYDFSDSIKAAVQDMLLVGRGVNWIELEVADQRNEVKAVYVGWMDFRHGPAKRWSDVPWVARRTFFTKEDVAAQFPDYADQVSLNFVDMDATKDADMPDDDAKRSPVWEVWDKASKRRIYVAEGCPVILGSDDDPYNQQGFFPCAVLYGLTTTDSLEPVPEFIMYQKAANELDHLEYRMSELTEQMKWAGVYDKGIQDADVISNLRNLKDGQFLPINTNGAVGDKGLSAAFMQIPVSQIAATIPILQARHDTLLQNIYQLTGISDIVRGGDGQEYATAEAQEIKARASTQRFSLKQKAVQDFTRDLMRMKAEIIAEHFKREQLEVMTGIPLPTAEQRDKARTLLAAGAQAQQAQSQVAAVASSPQAQAIAAQNPAMAAQAQAALPQMLPQDPLKGTPPEVIEQMKQVANADVTWEDVSGILRSDDRRNYSINVQTDITAFEDTDADKKRRMEFAQMVSQEMQTAVPGIQQAPQIFGPLAKELMLFLTKGYNVDRSMEDTIEHTMDMLIQTPPAPPPSPNAPDPQMLELEKLKMQHELELAKIRVQEHQQISQMEIQKANIELAIKQQEVELHRQQFQLKAASSADDRANKAADAELKSLEIQLKTAKVIEQNQAENAVDPLKAAYDRAIADGTFSAPFQDYVAAQRGSK
jgi:hypothetical protein